MSLRDQMSAWSLEATMGWAKETHLSWAGSLAWRCGKIWSREFNSCKTHWSVCPKGIMACVNPARGRSIQSGWEFYLELRCA
jgi:hypothetical protein